MHIRQFTHKDTDRIVEIWYTASIKAHDFIHPEYWQSKQDDMKNIYLPMSTTYVLEHEAEVIGFVSMVEHYLAAIFLDPEFLHRGYGRKLLDYVKGESERIELKVYQKNEHSVQFYIRNGFMIADQAVDEGTLEQEYVMTWER